VAPRGGLMAWYVADPSATPADLDVARMCVDLTMMHTTEAAETFRIAYGAVGGQLGPDPDAAHFWLVSDILGLCLTPRTSSPPWHQAAPTLLRQGPTRPGGFTGLRASLNPLPSTGPQAPEGGAVRRPPRPSRASSLGQHECSPDRGFVDCDAPSPSLASVAVPVTAPTGPAPTADDA